MKKQCLRTFSCLARPEFQPAGVDPALLKQIPKTLNQSLARAIGWGTPPNWSTPGWVEELLQTASLATLEAFRDRPAYTQVVFGAFIYQRVMSKVRNRSHSEWRFALPFQSEPGPPSTPELEQVASAAPGPDEQAVHRELALLVLALPPHERNLVLRLFWLGSTEAQEAKASGVSQAAVNQRKRSILRQLRKHLSETAAGDRRDKNRTDNAPHHLACKVEGRAYKNPNRRNIQYRNAVEGTPKSCRLRANKANPQPPASERNREQ